MLQQGQWKQSFGIDYVVKPFDNLQMSKLCLYYLLTIK